MSPHVSRTLDKQVSLSRPKITEPDVLLAASLLVLGIGFLLAAMIFSRITIDVAGPSASDAESQNLLQTAQQVALAGAQPLEQGANCTALKTIGPATSVESVDGATSQSAATVSGCLKDSQKSDSSTTRIVRGNESRKRGAQAVGRRANRGSRRAWRR